MKDKIRRKLLLGLVWLKKLKPLKMAEYARKNTEFYKRLYGDKEIRDFKSLPLVKKR